MRIKRTLSLLFAVLLLLISAGCGGPASNQADTDAVKAAVDKFRACESFTLSQITEIEETVTAEGMSYVYSGINEMQLQLITGPEFCVMTQTTMSQEFDGEQMQQRTASYVVPENGGYTEYFTDGLEWYKLSTDADVSLMGLSASAFVDTFFTDMIGFRKAAVEELEGGRATRYEGELEGENLLSMLEANGVLSALSSMSENQQAKIRDNLMKDLSGVTVKVWVEEDSGYPIRFEISLAQILGELNDSIAKSLGNKSSDQQVTTGKYLLSMSLGDFDAVEEIVLPPETANAQPYEGA